MHNPFPRAVLIAILGCAPFTVVACGAGRVICDYAAPAGTVTGPLLSRHGSTTTFRVDEFNPRDPPASLVAPVPVIGKTIDVHTANDPCSTGTTYANGSAIDTALVHQTWPRRVLFMGVFLALVIGVPRLVFGIRKQKRQRKNSERLLEARRVAAQRGEANHA